MHADGSGFLAPYLKPMQLSTCWSKKYSPFACFVMRAPSINIREDQHKVKITIRKKLGPANSQRRDCVVNRRHDAFGVSDWTFDIKGSSVSPATARLQTVKNMAYCCNKIFSKHVAGRKQFLLSCNGILVATVKRLMNQDRSPLPGSERDVQGMEQDWERICTYTQKK